MEIDKLDAFQPTQHDPQHVIIGLCPQAEGVLAEIKGGDLGEVTVDDVFPFLILQLEAYAGSRPSAVLPCLGHCGQGCGNVGAHDSCSPINGTRPLALPDGVEVGLHHVESLDEGGKGIGGVREVGGLGLSSDRRKYVGEDILRKNIR